MSGSRTGSRAFEFGRTHVVRPKGRHQATIVWLHGLGDKGSRYYGYSFADYHMFYCDLKTLFAFCYNLSSL